MPLGSSTEKKPTSVFLAYGLQAVTVNRLPPLGAAAFAFDISQGLLRGAQEASLAISVMNYATFDACSNSHDHGMRNAFPKRLQGISPFCVILVIIALDTLKKWAASPAVANPSLRWSGGCGLPLGFRRFLTFILFTAFI
jgi:hypothetical protein